MNEFDERRFTAVFDFVFKLVENKIGRKKACEQIDSILGTTIELYHKNED